MTEVVIGEIERIEALRRSIGPAVSVFGSARIGEGDAVFALTRDIAAALSAAGLTIISGGGPGLMRAANEGARRGGSPSVGFNIELPFERPDLRMQDVALTFQNFFTRKLAFARCSEAYVVMPGGLGTLDELFDILTLIKTRKLAPRPVALVGVGFWSGLIDWMRDRMERGALVDRGDLDAIGLFDDGTQVVRFVRERLGMPHPALASAV